MAQSRKGGGLRDEHTHSSKTVDRERIIPACQRQKKKKISELRKTFCAETFLAYLKNCATRYKPVDKKKNRCGKKLKTLSKNEELFLSSCFLSSFPFPPPFLLLAIATNLHIVTNIAEAGDWCVCKCDESNTSELFPLTFPVEKVKEEEEGEASSKWLQTSTFLYTRAVVVVVRVL